MSDGGGLPAEERLAWLRLYRTEHVGPVAFRQLLARLGSASAALAAVPDLARRGGRLTPPRIPGRAEAEAELAAAQRMGARLLTLADPGFSAALAAVSDAPPLLYARGEAALLTRPAVAVVGARNASASGQRFAENLARELGAAGLAVVSGLARGIDAAAHGGALAGGTIAVLAGGVDVVFPPENQKLYQKIVEQGLVLSEMPPGTRPLGQHFPRRNRVISGLSLGVVVVEAALRSGSLITARLALEQGREVFAVPGSPLDPRARGSNDLLRQGAVLTEEAEDVLAVLRPLLSRPLGDPAGDATPPPFVDPPADAHALVLELLSPTPVSQDEIVRRSKLTAGMVVAILLDLELAGRLDRHPGNRVSLRPN
ncbi:MAG: DNA-protecting protein DprA [Alphaproteobacteria bacterium]|nr:DNA-protecting protein DprA [Alphaproteobacteria bacterium]